MKKDTKHFRYLFPLVIGLTPLPYSPAYAQTLQEAVALAINSNPTILAANEELKTFKEKTTQAQAGLLPTINLTAAYGEEWNNTPSTRNAGEVSGLSLGRSEVGVTVSQKLYDGKETKYKIEQAIAKQQANKGKLLSTEETLTMAVATAYIDALQEQELLALQDQTISLHRKILGKVREMTSIGAGTAVDVRQAESRFALVASDRETNIGIKLSAEARYLKAVGQESENLTHPVLKHTLLPKSLEQALEIALERHPSVITNQSDLKTAIAEKNISKASFWPDLTLDLSATNTRNVSGTKSYSKSASAMLNFSYNVFNGGADSAKNRETNSNISKILEKGEETQRNIREAVESAWHTLKSSRRRIKHIERHVSVAKTVTKSYHDQFEIGSRSLVEVLDSENELHTAKKSLIIEQFQLMRTTMMLLSSMGILHETLSMPPKDVMQSIASKSDMLKANGLLLNLMDDEEFLIKLKTTDPDSQKATPKTKDDSVQNTIENLPPYLFKILSQEGSTYSPSLLEYLDAVQDMSERSSKNFMNEISVLDYISSINDDSKKTN
ncbi:MAG: TolC family outer membrane protein [Magnetococcales bacterium]|nr:TolC family outer membrane protein [Magnetococcales bacterium]